MTKDERIQGLLEANNLNVAKRRVLTTALKCARDYFSDDDELDRNIILIIDTALSVGGPG